MARELQWIPCIIENSGFSSERRFRIQIDNEEIVGPAYLDYLRREDRTKVPEDEPIGNGCIRGFVACRIVKREGDSVLIEVPSTDVISVPEDALSSV